MRGACTFNNCKCPHGTVPPSTAARQRTSWWPKSDTSIVERLSLYINKSGITLSATISTVWPVTRILKTLHIFPNQKGVMSNASPQVRSEEKGPFAHTHHCLIQTVLLHLGSKWYTTWRTNQCFTSRAGNTFVTLTPPFSLRLCPPPPTTHTLPYSKPKNKTPRCMMFL